MHARKTVRIIPGAVAACALPTGLGLVFTGLLLSGPNQTDLFLTLPVAICFLLGSPLSALLACRRLSKVENPEDLKRWVTSFVAGLKWSTIIHFSSALIYTMGFLALAFVNAGHAGGPGVGEAFSVLIMSGYINIFLWCFLTLPFASICSTIFWGVTNLRTINPSFKV